MTWRRPFRRCACSPRSQGPAMASALLGFGGNVGDVRTTLNQGGATMGDGRDWILRYASSHYRTPPWGVLNQPRFINMAISVFIKLTARERLQRAFTAGPTSG